MMSGRNQQALPCRRATTSASRTCAFHLVRASCHACYTKIIGAFIETVRQPERFAAALDRAEKAGKPVVALKVGRASRTRHAVTTHTGGEAGDPGAISELRRAHRAIEVADLVELTEVLAAFQHWKPPAGRRIGVKLEPRERKPVVPNTQSLFNASTSNF
jgi:hypothetical protein